MPKLMAGIFGVAIGLVIGGAMIDLFAINPKHLGFAALALSFGCLIYTLGATGHE